MAACLASCFLTFLLWRVQKSKFQDIFWTRKWPSMSLSFSGFLIIYFLPLVFIHFLSFCCSSWTCTGLASSSRIPEKASLRRTILSMQWGNLVPQISLLCFPWSLGERPWLVKKSVGREGWQNVLIVAMTNFVGFKTSSVVFVPYVLVYHTYIIYLSAQCRLGNWLLK